MLKSTVCRYEHFLTPWYARWAERLELNPVVAAGNNDCYRKFWEWTVIVHALEERGMLAPGKKGIGFAVGREPLSSLFAARGVEVLATDLDADDSGLWIAGNQHASGLAALHHESICDTDSFNSLVHFQPADMRDITTLPSETYDFAWSSCAMEHLGTLDDGLDFVRKAMRLLKPGGVAVHTTEFNCSSNSDTITEGWNVIYRRQDIEGLDYSLRPMRCGVEAFDSDVGTHPFDLDYDEAPFLTRGKPHIKLMLDGYVSTSALLIVRKH